MNAREANKRFELVLRRPYADADSFISSGHEEQWRKEKRRASLKRVRLGFYRTVEAQADLRFLLVDAFGTQELRVLFLSFFSFLLLTLSCCQHGKGELWLMKFQLATIEAVVRRRSFQRQLQPEPAAGGAKQSCSTVS